MTVWNDLPIEILDLIFSTTKNDRCNAPFTLRQCQLVCKDWNALAQKHLYQDIFLKHAYQLDYLLETLNSSSLDLGKFLKRLHVDPFDSAVVPDMTMIHQLLLKCPNVESLDTPPDVSSNIFKVVQIAYEGGACKHLQAIPELRIQKPRAIQLYYDTAYCLRSNLRKLTLDENADVTSNITPDSLLQSLNEFPNLRFLTLSIKCTETFYHIGQYIEGCPHFAKLQLSWPSSIDTNTLDVSSTIPCLTVKDLILDRILVTKKLLEYIMYAFPNLNTFIMDAVQDSNSTAKISKGLWVQFLVYLDKFKRHIRVDHLYIIDMVNVLTDYFDTIKSNNTLRILYTADSSTRPYMNVHRDSMISRDPSCIITAVFRETHYKDQPSPHMKLIQRTGRFLKSLAVDGRDASVHWGYSKLFSVDYIFQRCPFLVELELSNLAITNHDLTQQNNAPIKYIKLKNCLGSHELFPRLSAQLRSLSDLYLSGYSHLETIGSSLKNNSYIVEMPDTSFDNLTWKELSPYGSVYSTMYLKLVTPAESHHYIGYTDTNTGFTESSDISFLKAWNNPNVFSLCIQCKSVKTLKVKYQEYLWEFTYKSSAVC
jgi:hypothetical protein